MLSEEVLWPNGIGVSPDGEHGLRQRLRPRRRAGRGLDGRRDARVRAACRRGSADGLALDVEGGVWVALGEGGGVARFHADGTLDELIEPAGELRLEPRRSAAPTCATC